MGRTECIGDSCNFGTLLNENGKLEENWVRGALLSIERNPSSAVDLEEVFSLFDADCDGKLNVEEVSNVFDIFGNPLGEKSNTFFADCDRDDDGKITFNEFIEQYKISGGDVADEEVQGLKGVFSFQNEMML